MDVNAFNTAGQTALHGAVGRGEPVVELLVSRGATLLQEQGRASRRSTSRSAQGGRGGRGGVVREGAAAILRQLAPDGGPKAAPPAP